MSRLRDRVPPDTLRQLDKYVRYHVPPGGFLWAVLSDNLYVACQKADETNRAAFFDIVAYVEGELPIPARGSDENVRAWLLQ